MQLIARSKWVKLPLTFLMLIGMNGCVTDLTVPVDSYCAVSKPISYDSKKDTPETVKEIELHNSRWACLCDKDCPANAD